MALGEWYLNGTKLSPWNLTYSESSEVIGGETRMLSGLGRRDITARKLNVALSWTDLEETFSGTYHAYSDLRALGTNAGTMTFLRPVGTSTGTEAFKVFVSTPEGQVSFRDTGTVFWDCSINLVEA